MTTGMFDLNRYLNSNKISGFAVKNSRYRFLIPSNCNSFGGINIEYVLIDSGSNSSLFPLPLTLQKVFDINGLMETFSFNKYNWSIGSAHGVGLISDTTLHIKSITDHDGLALHPIQCILHFDLKPLPFELPYLRFSLDRDSIQTLIDMDNISIPKFDRESLRTTLNFLDEFRKTFPLLKSKSNRDNCLLGQHFLKNVCSIQVNDVMMFIEKQMLQDRLFPPNDSNVLAITDFLYRERPGFSKTEEFLNCDDDEHGGKDLFNISNQQIDIDE